MRLFFKISHILQVSRCFRYHAPICRPRQLLSAGQSAKGRKTSSGIHKPILLRPVTPQPPIQHIVQFQLCSQNATSSNVFTFNPAKNMQRKRISFTGTHGNEGAKCVLPVGVITPEGEAGKSVKIIVVPLDIANMDIKAFQQVLDSLNLLRKHAHQIESVTTEMIEEKSAAADKDVPTAGSELNFWDSYLQHGTTNAVGTAAKSQFNAQQQQCQAATAILPAEKLASVEFSPPGPAASPTTPNLPLTPNVTPNHSPTPSPNTTVPGPSALPCEEPKGAPQVNANVANTEEITINVPQSLEDRLSELAISSMQLSFEMDMTNICDALKDVEGGANKSSSYDSSVLMETKVELNSQNVPKQTVPLKFNALIRGIIEVDPTKEQLQNLSEHQVPQFNDSVTSIAAKLCSTALQKGFPATDGVLQQPQPSGGLKAHATNALQHAKASKHMKAHEESRYMGTQVRPKIFEDEESKDGCKHPPIKPKKKCPKKCPLLDDPCDDKPCKPIKPIKKEKKLKTNCEITSMAGKEKDPCAKFKKGEKKDKKKKKKDPCDKFKKKKDPCAKFKKDKKKKKKDPCAKFKKGKKDKKKDPCAKFKKGDKDKKKDPCAKFKKKPKKKKDPCDKFKKKKDPCAKFKKKSKPKKKKKDPCDKFKKKEDPCAKFKKKSKPKKKKKDPCDKFKKKKDPCAKFKKKPKKDPCAKKFSTYFGQLDWNTLGKRSLCTALGMCFLESYNPTISEEKSSYTPTIDKGPRFQIYSTLVRRHYGTDMESKRKPITETCCPMNKEQRNMGPRFQIYSSLVRRQYSSPCKGVPKKDNKGNKVCENLKNKCPKKDKFPKKKKRRGLKTDCFGDGGCPQKCVKGKCPKSIIRQKKCHSDGRFRKNSGKKK